MDNLESAKRFFLEALEHHNNNRLQEAEELYRQAYALAPGRLSVLSNLAAVLAGQRRYAEAREFCELALAIEPEHFDTLRVSACCLRETSDPASSLRLLQRLLVLRPNDPEIHNTMGIVLGDLGCDEEALRSYDQALDLNREHTGALVNRSRVLAKLGRLAEAFVVLKQVLTDDP
jgi:tetratricopeptide (TPR) repeat protein